MTDTHEETVTITLPIPDGYEATNEFRTPEPKEFYLDPNGAGATTLNIPKAPSSFERVILRRKLPDTVNVALPRDVADEVVKWLLKPQDIVPEGEAVARAIRAALAAEAEAGG